MTDIPLFFFSSRRRHTRWPRDWSSDVCSSDLYTLPLFGIGAAIFMIGVIQGMYWYHRRIWINPDGEGILLAAHTNKNWHGLEREIEKIIDGTNIKMIEDQEENKELSTEDSEAN